MKFVPGDKVFCKKYGKGFVHKIDETEKDWFYDFQIGNIYPVMYAKTFFEGMTNEGQSNIINLIRCAWAGSQRYGALVWLYPLQKLALHEYSF